MAQGQTTTLKSMLVDNKTITAVSKVVELVVVNNNLVPDHREANPGVIDKGFKHT